MVLYDDTVTWSVSFCISLTHWSHTLHFTTVILWAVGRLIFSSQEFSMHIRMPTVVTNSCAGPFPLSFSIPYHLYHFFPSLLSLPSFSHYCSLSCPLPLTSTCAFLPLTLCIPLPLLLSLKHINFPSLLSFPLIYSPLLIYSILLISSSLLSPHLFYSPDLLSSPPPSFLLFSWSPLLSSPLISSILLISSSPLPSFLLFSCRSPITACMLVLELTRQIDHLLPLLAVTGAAAFTINMINEAKSINVKLKERRRILDLVI